MRSSIHGDTKGIETGKPFRFSLATLLALVGLAAISLAHVTNHDEIFHLLLLTITTVVLLAAVLVTSLRRDKSAIEVVAAMVVYYAVSRLCTTASFLFGYVPHIGLAVGLLAAVIFLLCNRPSDSCFSPRALL